MPTYTLCPVRHVGVTLEPCALAERELWAIYQNGTEYSWIADFSPHSEQIAKDFVRWLNLRAKMLEALDIVTPKAANEET